MGKSVGNLDNLVNIVEITAPVFLLAAIGVIWARTGVGYDLAFVTRLGINLAMPCLIFSVLARAEIEASALRDMAVAALGAHAILLVLFWGLLRAGGFDIGVYLPPLWFANTGNMGLGVVFFAYGEAGLALGMVFFAISAGLGFSAGVWVVVGGRSLEALKQPMVYAALAGVLFAWQGWQLPEALMRGVDLIGQIGIPLMLITLGVSVSALTVGDLWRPVLLSLFKVAVCTAGALITVVVFGLDGTVAGVLALQMIMPAGITTYIIAQRYGAAPGTVAGIVVVSTVMSLAVIPAALAIVLS